MNLITFLKNHRTLTCALQSVIISVIVLISICQFSCKVDEQSISIDNGNYTSPKLNSYSVKSAREVNFAFSRTVSLNDMEISPDIGIAAVSFLESLSGGEYAVTFQNKMKIGEVYSLYGIAVDTSGNSLTFCVPVQGYNDSVPSLEITEAQIKYSSGNGRPICEYIEIRALSSGNLAGVGIYSGTDGDMLTFPSIEVKSGEIITAHLRNPGSGAISELQDDLTLSMAETSSNNARDIWSENTKARLNDSADVVLLKNTANGTILDALLYAKNGVEQWKNDTLKDAAESAVHAGLWYPDARIASAVDISGVSYAKSITRIASGHNAAAWAIKPRNAGEVYGKNAEESTSPSIPTTSPGKNPIPIEITEAQIKYSSDTEGNAYACEFVELRATRDTNLLGLEIFSASDGYSKSFFLPSVEIKRGEIVTVHLRSAGEGCISELDDNLNLSTATYSAKDARDIWAENKDSPRLNDNADIILIRDPSAGIIVDALPYAKSTYENWQSNVESIAKMLSDDVWLPNTSIAYAACSDETSDKKSLQRVSPEKKASSWIVAPPTPGTVAY